ncbi:MAG: chemotaxis protein CheD, partial [Deltaproteobacteria bacterium]
MNIVVGIGDYKVTKEPSVTLITYSLGSCIGVTVYDPAAKVGGMLHFMLPESRINPERAIERPAIFADTGLPLLLKECEKLGADRKR